MFKPNLAVKNLKGVVIVIVLAFHSVLAYLDFSPASSFAFDNPPYRWLSVPIVDSERWFGFDLFCALQDLYLMTLMFFISGLFVWPSLVRKGSRTFLFERALRLGLPFCLVVGLLMPLAYYPVYRLTAIDTSLGAYREHFLALPFWPSGPPWFLGILLVFDLAATLVYQLSRNAGDVLPPSSVRPRGFVIVLLLASAVAYVPLALIFTPWRWAQFGPFGLQLSRPLHYAVYFFAGVVVGAHGIDRGLLATDGTLVRSWNIWLAAAMAAFVAWLGVAGLAMQLSDPPVGLQIVQALCFVASCGSTCMLLLTLFLRFANQPWPALDFLSDNAFGVYLVHYVFVVWLQYLLLGVASLAIIKALVVFGGTLILSYATIAAVRRVAAVVKLMGTDRRVLPSGR
jgi:glucans biosynthesis protein C